MKTNLSFISLHLVFDSFARLCKGVSKHFVDAKKTWLNKPPPNKMDKFYEKANEVYLKNVVLTFLFCLCKKKNWILQLWIVRNIYIDMYFRQSQNRSLIYLHTNCHTSLPIQINILNAKCEGFVSINGKWGFRWIYLNI